MILLSFFDGFCIAAAAISLLFIAGLIYRSVSVNRFRKRILTAPIDPYDPMVGYFFINEEKYQFVLVGRNGSWIHVRFRDDEGEKTRSVGVNDLYPSLW